MTEMTEKEKTLAELGTPYAEQYFGGWATGHLVSEYEAERDLAHHAYVGDMTLREFYEGVEREIALEFGD